MVLSLKTIRTRNIKKDLLLINLGDASMNQNDNKMSKDF